MEKDPVTELAEIGISLGGESYFKQNVTSTEEQLGRKMLESRTATERGYKLATNLHFFLI